MKFALVGLVAVLVGVGGMAVAASPPDRVRLAAPFGDGMVVQRDRPVPVWGEAPPGSAVRVEFGPKSGEATADAGGRWLVRLDPVPAGGPHTLKVAAGGQTAEARDVLVGDVWLCSGQSNMQMTLKECDGGPAAAEAAATLPRLRLASVGRRASDKPERSAEVRWRAATPETARDFSAIGFYLAAGLLADPALRDVPLGVVDCSFGGSRCEAWVPAGDLSGIDPAELRPSLFSGGPSCLYNGMVAPLGPIGLRGAVWYQGEGNSDRPAAYPTLLSRLIAAWRAQFEAPALPFVIVGLPDWARHGDSASWAWLREAQAKVSQTVPHVALAWGIGTTDGFDLHPRQKAELGRRAALAALRVGYGRADLPMGPTLKMVRVDDGVLRVEFTAADGLRTRDGGPVRGFAVAGADGRYRFVPGAIDGGAVVLHPPDGPAPRTVRYAWAGVPDGNLTDGSGLPAAPFRTDSLALPEVEVQPRPGPRVVQTRSYEVAVDGTGSVTSLGVGGKQFVANGLKGAGGTSVPGWFGPRELGQIHQSAPDRITCEDGEAGLDLAFQPDAMDWTVRNKSGNAFAFRVALAPQVDVAGTPGAGGVLTLSRGPARLSVAGVEAVTRGDDGPMLEIKVEPRSEKRLTFRVPGP